MADTAVVDIAVAADIVVAVGTVVVVGTAGAGIVGDIAVVAVVGTVVVVGVADTAVVVVRALSLVPPVVPAFLRLELERRTGHRNLNLLHLYRIVDKTSNNPLP